MTVKVVSDRPVKPKRVVCPRCSFELEFTGEDVRVSVDSYGDVSKSIICPRRECEASAKYPSVIWVEWP